MTRTYLGTAGPFRGIGEKNENTGRIPEQREKVRQKGDAWWWGREDEAREGEGDATRLINRHADNHSGFMVTTDYQVVQGGIFHIRDVTLFQWGNTCSARYKLHERAYTERHVCCMSASHRYSNAYACMYPRARTSLSWLEKASRCPALLVPSLPTPLSPLPSQNHSHVQRLQKCPATFPRERSPDRSPAT